MGMSATGTTAGPGPGTGGGAAGTGGLGGGANLYRLVQVPGQPMFYQQQPVPQVR